MQIIIIKVVQIALSFCCNKYVISRQIYASLKNLGGIAFYALIQDVMYCIFFKIMIGW